MKMFYKIPRSILLVSLLFIAGFILTKCMDADKSKENISENNNEVVVTKFSQYAGSASCAGCHKDVFDQHLKTAHHLSSMPADKNSIMGSFAKGNNRYVYTPNLYVEMQQHDSGLFQTIYYKGEKRKQLRFDIVTGSGTKGQTYLYWDHNKLFQLPISYFSAPAMWSVSPGFQSDKVTFDKPITSRCLECHVTFAERISEPDIKNEEFDRSKILFGIGCEKCHGPAAEHVTFHSKNDQEQKAKFIIDPSEFSRQQKLDMCVLCHGGNIQKTKPTFSYLPGNKLTDHFVVDSTANTAVTNGTIDVHGNQYGLLKASKCFQLTQTMTCNTCHDPHEKERGNLTIFSQRCMSCHTPGHNNFCTISPQPAGIQSNCIDCHMPKQPSMSVTLFREGEQVPTAAMIRTHFISIYPDETKKFKPLVKE